MKSKFIILLFLFLQIAFSEQLIDLLSLDLNKLDCQNLDQILTIKKSLTYWKDLQTKDINVELGELLLIKEQLLDQKESLLQDNLDHKSIKTSFIQKSALTQEIKRLLHQIPQSNSKLELCDLALHKLNSLISKMFNEKEQLQIDKASQITTYLDSITNKEIKCNARLRTIDTNTPILMTFEVDENQTDEVGYGYWVRMLNLNEPQFKKNVQFLSRVSQNEEYSDEELGDRKLGVHLHSNNVIFSTYDIKSMSTVKRGSIKLEDSSKWFYIYYSFKDGKAIGFVKNDIRISRAEFHVEHFKLGEAWFKFGGVDLGIPGVTGQLAQLTYGVGPGYYVDNAKEFVHLYQKDHPQPEMVKQTVTILDSLTNFPKDINSQIKHEFIFEYAVSGWFKMSEKELKEVLIVKDEINKYALSFYGGNSLSVATYTKETKFRKFKLFDDKFEWHYVYMSYSYFKQEYNAFLWADQKVLKVQETNVQHQQTKSLSLEMGKTFHGQANYVRMYIGEGSHIETPSQLPEEFKVGVEFLHNDIHSYKIQLNSKVTEFVVLHQNIEAKSLQVEKYINN